MDEAMNVLKEYISMENLFIIPFLVLIGNGIKKSTRFDDTTIPNILGVLGILLCALVSFSNNQPYSLIQWVLLAVVSIGQGVCVAGVAVYLNQWLKQNRKYKQMRAFDGENPVEMVNACPICGQKMEIHHEN